ncbi:MAG: serine/threonine protein kinase [Alphaproteobacteria bacterium]|nr:serine/threonine protein kinase [Alphaproteobacteria bacterium]
MPPLSSNTRYCARCLSTFEDDHEHCPNLSCRRPRPGAGWGRMYGPGDLFDRHYRIHQLLALGGAGVTYLAREVGLDGQEYGPRLALKVLFATRDEGPYLRRLATEAQLLQQLDHPNIVMYLGFVHRAGHSPYLVTRFEPGGSLLDHVKRVGALPVKQAAGICRQICWALEKAHDKNVVHRDLKPENVLLSKPVAADEDPICRVADFGIAKVQGSLSGHTRVGAFVGTPMYAAPEQFIGAPPTSATDVYAIGALLYFCTMVMPVVRFADRLDPEESYKLLVDALPPTVRRAGEPEDDVRRLNEVLKICMAEDPRNRCRVTQLEALLGAIVDGRDPDCEAARPKRAAPTLSTDPDTGEVVRNEPTKLSDHKDDDGSGALGVLAGVAAGAALGAAGAWLARKDDTQDDAGDDTHDAAAAVAETVRHARPSGPGDPALLGPGQPTKTGKQAQPVTRLTTERGDDDTTAAATPGADSAPTSAATPAEPPVATPAEALAEAPTPDPTPEPPAAPEPGAAPEPTVAPAPAKGGGCGKALFGLVFLGGLLAVGGYVGALVASPGLLPSAIKPPVVVLDPGRPADLAHITQLRAALQPTLAKAKAECGSGKVTAELIIEPRGQVRSVKLSGVKGDVDAECVGGLLADTTLPPQGLQPVKVGLALDL